MIKEAARKRMEQAGADVERIDAAGDKRTLIYCGSGKRSLFPAQTLKELDMQRPVSMDGGLTAWHEAGKLKTQARP